MRENDLFVFNREGDFGGEQRMPLADGGARGAGDA